MTRRAYFLLFPGCEILDFAGPVQALHEANYLGRKYELAYCGASERLLTAQGLEVSSLDPLPSTGADDWIFVPGLSLANQAAVPRSVIRWLRRSHDAGARLCSVCTGAFLLGTAGLLDGRRCTTHWRRVDDLQQRFPLARVIHDRLFVTDESITTSAGIAAGIDMTLHLIEEDHGPSAAAAVAREMVVYMRRDGAHRQESVYLDYQQHLNPAIHRVQHFLVQNPGSRESLAELAIRFNMSPRNLSRVFRRATGLSVHEYRSRLRLDYASTLLRNPAYTVRRVAELCGFADERQLRRMFDQRLGRSPRREIGPLARSGATLP